MVSPTRSQGQLVVFLRGVVVRDLHPLPDAIAPQYATVHGLGTHTRTHTKKRSKDLQVDVTVAVMEPGPCARKGLCKPGVMDDCSMPGLLCGATTWLSGNIPY